MKSSGCDQWTSNQVTQSPDTSLDSSDKKPLFYRGIILNTDQHSILLQNKNGPLEKQSLQNE